LLIAIDYHKRERQTHWPSPPAFFWLIRTVRILKLKKLIYIWKTVEDFMEGLTVKMNLWMIIIFLSLRRN